MKSVQTVLAFFALLSFSFSSQAALPTATTGPADSITPTTASLNGSVVPKTDDTDVWFEIGTTTNYDNATSVITLPAGNSPVPVTLTASNLTPGTVYHYRAVA